MSSEHGNHLVTMITNSNESSRGWLKFLITVEGALAVGFGYIANNPTISGMHLFMAIVISVLGVVLACGLVRVIVRHHKWQAWFIKKYVALPGNVHQVFPGDVENVPSNLDEIDPGFTAGIIKCIVLFIVILWIIAAAAILLAWSKGSVNLTCATL